MVLGRRQLARRWVLEAPGDRCFESAAMVTMTSNALGIHIHLKHVSASDDTP